LRSNKLTELQFRLLGILPLTFFAAQAVHYWQINQLGHMLWMCNIGNLLLALGLFFDEMVNTFDPDALIVGGGAIETSEPFQRWFTDEIRAGMPSQREEQADIPIYVMPNGDTAGARGAAIEALKYARRTGLL